MRIRTWLGGASALAVVATVAGGLLLGSPLAAPAQPQARSQAKKTPPRIEVVFCIDTTGSMTGLIDGAKQKVWSLCNQIAGGKPAPDLKVGLVAYRDRGDAYITKTFDLTDDLDAVHDHLMGFQADGGGDEPESVNEALHVALHNAGWSSHKNVLRIIYLVGDAPPHMDYANDIPYKVTCREACERGIIINTIQCGSAPSTTQFWQDIAHKAEGRFVQIAQDGGVQTVSTPYDKRLAEINVKLAQSTVTYGDAPAQAAAQTKMIAAATQMPAAACAPRSFGTSDMPSGSCAPVPGVAMMAAADRAGYCAKTGKVGAWDLLDSIKEGRVKLEDLKGEQLPPEMQKMNLAERKGYLAKVEGQRSKLQAEALELDRQRSDYISQELRKNRNASGFDSQVLDILRVQAKAIGVAY
jgi:Mg-chelatase subunit ChlD